MYENLFASTDRIEARINALLKYQRELEDKLAAPAPVPPAPVVDFSALEARLAALENLFPPVPNVPVVEVQPELPLEPVAVVEVLVDAIPAVINPDRMPPVE
jgi:hypothetical protein